MPAACMLWPTEENDRGARESARANARVDEV